MLSNYTKYDSLQGARSSARTVCSLLLMSGLSVGAVIIVEALIVSNPLLEPPHPVMLLDLLREPEQNRKRRPRQLSSPLF